MRFDANKRSYLKWPALLLVAIIHLHASSAIPPCRAVPIVDPVPNVPGGPSGPQLIFENPVYEFGRTAAGDVVQCLFKFANPGDSMLRIEDVSTTCGCTSTGVWNRVLQPNEMGVLPIQLDTSHLNGEVQKIISVTSNAKAQSNMVLVIKGSVWQPIEILPPHVVFGVVSSRNTITTRDLRIVNNGSEPITVHNPECSSDRYRVDLRTLKPGREFQLSVTTVPPLTNGLNLGLITFTTSVPQKPVVAISAQIVVQPLQIFPPRVVLYGHTNDEPFQRSVIIKNNQGYALQLSKVSINSDEVSVRLQEMIPGVQYRIDLTFPKQFQIPLGKPVTLSMETNLSETPLIEVPVLQP